jgi:peptidoglycan/LPS O-acetylase OafA/YrhL
MSAATCLHEPHPPRPQEPPPPARSPALDRLRGIALVAMLVHHLTEWLTGDARAVLPGWRSFVVTDVAAVAFFCAAGASMALLASGRRRRGAPRAGVAAEIARRYGLLVPIGVALHWLLWRDAFTFGVLEALGVAVVVAAAVVAAVPGRFLTAAAVATLVLGAWCERVADGRGGAVEEVIGGKFPLVTYVGFVLVGAAVVRGGRLADRRWAAAALVTTVAATVAVVASGIAPDRYPGGISFVVPGLAGTAVAWGVGHLRWPTWFGAVDRALRQAGLRAFGIFVAHYALLGVLRHAGITGTVTPAVAVAVALLVTVALCVVAPLVPELPWSLRRGTRARRPTDRATAAGAAGHPPDPATAGADAHPAEPATGPRAA